MTFQDKVVSVDPLATLASAMVEAGGAISSDTAAAMAFLPLYSPAVASTVIPTVEGLRLRMTPGALSSMERVGNALSVRELLQRIQMNIGGGG